MSDSLPIDGLIPGIVESLRKTPNLVIEAAPGAGKTTRVPPALLVLGGEVLVLEPRRIAARMAASRIASEMREQLGQTVGYQVRFEKKSSATTRLWFLTEGVLTRRLQSDPELLGVSTVILDEFHERHLETDLALALLRRLQKTRRPDLRIVVMSATLDAEPVRRFLGDCPAVRSEGRLFDLTISWTPYSGTPVEEQVAAAFESISTDDGDVLAFLPGSATIHRTARLIEPSARKRDTVIAKLYGDLPPEEQDRAVTRSGRRKIILSTNIAESSVTIDGVTCVIDSGLARIATDSPWTGLPSLNIGRISKASATQRSGRAARTAPGRAIRLYTAEDFHRRPDHDEPEISRRELCQMCLQLAAMGFATPFDLDWLSKPPVPAVAASQELLARLGITNSNAARYASLPLHPRLSKLVTEAERTGAAHSACATAALLSSGQRVKSTDLLHALDEQPDFHTAAIIRQLSRRARGTGVSDDDALAKAVLAAFPDRVGRIRSGGVVLLPGGKSARLTESPPRASGFLVAVDIEDSNERSVPWLRLSCPIQPDWLLDMFPDRISERTAVEWDRQSERVVCRNEIVYDDLVIDESEGTLTAEARSRAASLLAERALDSGLARFLDIDRLNALLARVEFAASHSAIAPFDSVVMRAEVESLCEGLRSFAELEKAAGGFIPALLARVDARLLDRIAPSEVRLPSGRVARIHYEAGKTPWVESRLQDFFGMREGPAVAGGKVPLVVHLLAPNRRPVQTTTDLAGFWSRLYPRVRKELSRRYPRHSWPEDPFKPASD